MIKMSEKIDRRRHYYLVLDIETANSTEDPLCYDLGFAVVDKHGTIYDEYSFIISEIFYGEQELMRSAYYAKKLPQYYIDIVEKKRTPVSLFYAKRFIKELMLRYGIDEVFAYNARFDRNGLNTTIRYITKSRLRFFFPYGTKISCIQHMACQTILSQKNYFRYAIEHGLVSPSGNLSTTAESAFKYISGNADFAENHTGLEDVHIETKILAKCFAQHKKIDRDINPNAWRLPQKSFKEFKKTLDK